MERFTQHAVWVNLLSTLPKASERENKRIQEQREQEEDNLAEMFNLLSSDMLTENKSSANSNFGINRKITANYRGMTDEERDEILCTQKAQQIELNVSWIAQLEERHLHAISVKMS